LFLERKHRSTVLVFTVLSLVTTLTVSFSFSICQQRHRSSYESERGGLCLPLHATPLEGADVPSTPKTSVHKLRNGKFQQGLYNKPIVLIGCRGAGNELNHLAASAITKLDPSSFHSTAQAILDQSEEFSGIEQNGGSIIRTVGVDKEGDWTLKYSDVKSKIEDESLTKSSIFVLDFDAPEFNIGEGKNANKITNALTDLAKSFYEDESMLVVYVNVRPETGKMSHGGIERKKKLEKDVFIKYSDYELCIDNNVLGIRKTDAEWELNRLLARAFLPPATPGASGPSINCADLTMGENSFFLSLSFPNANQVEPFVKSMCDDVDAMEMRIDLLSDRDDRFEVLKSLQTVRSMCRPHATRAPMLPFQGDVIDDSLPFVYTVRTANQAGTYPDDDEGIGSMFDLLDLGLRAGVEVLDVESAWDETQLDELLTKAETTYNTQILGSHHVVGEKISTEDAVHLFRKSGLSGRAHASKLVLSIEDEKDDRQAYHAATITESLTKKNGDPVIPLVSLILGDVGKYSRVLNLPFTPVTHESLPFVAAPGQMTASELMTSRLLLGVSKPRKFAILGHDISYSVSPAMHTAAFEATKLPNSYSLIDMEDVSEFVNSDLWNDDNFGGTSVTIPHKQAIIPHLDVLTTAANAIGAVNTVIVKWSVEDNGERKRVLVGDNTDWRGIYNPLSRKLGKSFIPNSVSAESNSEIEAGISSRSDVALILGGGGTARAAAYAAVQLGLERIYYNRTPAKAEELAKEFGGTVVTSLNEFSKITQGDDNVVKTGGISLGSILESTQSKIRVIISTLPAAAEFVIPDWLAESLKSESNKPIILDVNYKPYWTNLLVQSHEAEFEIVRGSEMLWEQGVGQFELWTGRTAPYKVMKDVVLSNCMPVEEERK